MKKIEKLEINIRKKDEYSLFHDTRGDVRILAKAINEIADKQNEIIDAINKLIEESKK